MHARLPRQTHSLVTFCVLDINALCIQAMQTYANMTPSLMQHIVINTDPYLYLSQYTTIR